jgi:DNA-binding transcriptional ArsR family regulator
VLASANGEVGDGGVRAVPGVRIFEAFTPDERVLSVSQIARRAGLHLATASRLIAELEAHGLLDREPDRRVRVGVRMWELALDRGAARGHGSPGRPAPPRHWANPNAFDLTRDPSGHVGFGMGLHQCVGQHVARLEGEAVLTALARRVASIELAAPPRRHHNNTLRALESLPVRLRLAR